MTTSFGFLNIDKPAGPTSHDVVARVRRLLPRKTKVGHAGTLDPFATGVLVVCVGGATRLAEYVQEMTKEYRARIRLGARSTTGDGEGRIDTVEGASPPAIESVRGAVDSFVGAIDQVPPAHSAVHVDGRRAYRLARDGRDVDIPPRRVRIDAVAVVEYEYPALELRVRCGAGTYIRSLAGDIGEHLGCGGYCDALRRTAVGPFTAEDALRPEDLTEPPLLLAPQQYLDLPRAEISCEEREHIRHGRPIEPRDIAPGGPDIILVDPDGRLAAVGRVDADSGAIRPAKVFCSE